MEAAVAQKMTASQLGPWHDLIERLWRDVDPATLSPDFQDYVAAQAEFMAYLETLGPPGTRIPEYPDCPARVLSSRIARISARIFARAHPTATDLAEMAILLRDEVLVRGTADGSFVHGPTFARLVVGVIEAAFQRPPH